MLRTSGHCGDHACCGGGGGGGGRSAGRRTGAGWLDLLLDGELFDERIGIEAEEGGVPAQGRQRQGPIRKSTHVAGLQRFDLRDGPTEMVVHRQEVQATRFPGQAELRPDRLDWLRCDAVLAVAFARGRSASRPDHVVAPDICLLPAYLPRCLQSQTSSDAARQPPECCAHNQRCNWAQSTRGANSRGNLHEREESGHACSDR